MTSRPALTDALRAERAHHDDCRAALAAMVEGAAEQVVIGEDVSASGADAEVLGHQLRSQAKALRELPPGPLFFGRLDFARDHPEHGGLPYHLGRLRLTESPAAPPLVVDWRAPVSRAFYQASARDPQGVAVRRRFGWAPGSTGETADLTGFEDERLDGGGGEGDGTLRPAGIVARELERPRVGPMRDIAATIQPEQDDLVRAALADSVCVQGAPGTGKTAVGLHRAAYLLYTHPKRLQRAGLLILGPHRTFLAYISEVLPALGEGGVRQSTLLDEIARHPVTGSDPLPAAALKHDPRMAEVLRRALYAHVTTDGVRDLAVPDGSYRWRVRAAELAAIVEEVRAQEPPYAVGRERVRTRVVRRLRDLAERRSGVLPAAWVRRMEHARPLTAQLDLVWPKVRPEEVLARLLTEQAELARAADGVLEPGEQQELRWARPPRSYKSARWSAADLVLLDELSGLIEHPASYGHIMVDEAQDLSPMECRAIARRAVFGSLTVLGDLAQGTAPWAARDWSAQLRHLGRPDAAVVSLTTGFRVPAAVVALANRLLARLAVAVPPARSLRTDGELTLRPAEDVLAATVAAARRALAREGSVGVIAADADVPALARALAGAGLEPAAPDALGARLALVPASVAKGLEYDHVIAVEPAAVTEAEERGAHRLYVVLTRAVSRLDVVHGRPLPF
ncbi:AAA family ATPase [Streptomyces sp. SID8366]|uniref:HelD family protein n=1 Tax=unclassified Streptomyces TaxID=2593676 RepID=UPI000DBA01C2|nr:MULTISPECIES: AAA family ATPase [unclassified Streptomyces]MYU04768.1 AAA family ATPase [Streptomyces sp. SID8366]MYU63089.1 AAA family ATPase [Streptomyces sp. SID69]RAJ58663.1 DNA helicase IV [Streptomyces sp. PsTaAH-130]